VQFFRGVPWRERGSALGGGVGRQMGMSRIQPGLVPVGLAASIRKIYTVDKNVLGKLGDIFSSLA
jgi:hypothetical protein